jgi:acyl dehydratase
VEHVVTIAPRPESLVRDYLRYLGAPPPAKGAPPFVPPHFFPQWIFPVAKKTLDGLPYNLLAMVNGGCRMEVHGPLPADEPLQVRARLEKVDDNGRRALLHQRVTTGTLAEPELLVVVVYEIIPLRRGRDSGPRRPRPSRPMVPTTAREVDFWKLSPQAGLQFAALTGDFNPVHWLRPYARAFGFSSIILHGFATMARAIEGLNGAIFAGDTQRIKVFDCRFVRPLPLPARVGLFREGQQVYVGEGLGGLAYLVGTFDTERTASTREESHE